MSRSGWWSAFSARKARATTKAIASAKPSKRYSFTISSPWRSHPDRRPRPSSTCASLSFAMSPSSGIGFVKDLVQLQDLARGDDADETAAGVHDGQSVDVCGLHGRHRFAQRPARAPGRQVVPHDPLHDGGLPLPLVDTVELVEPGHAQVPVLTVDDRDRLLAGADQLEGEQRAD